MMGPPMSSNPKHFLIPIFRGGPTPTDHFVTTAAVALRLSDALRHRFQLGFLLRPSFKDTSHLGDVSHLKDMCHERTLQFTGLNCFQWSVNAFSGALMGLSFFSGNVSRSNKDLGKPQSRTSRRDLSEGRQWTNILVAANVLVFMAQHVSDGKLLQWGAKINGLIAKGQLWRLATSSLLHANIRHLLVNCYSLNSVGPTVENICGPRRYLSIYITSAIASSAMSYWLCKAPAVGASGAIFGLVGSYAMYALRHRGIIEGTEEDLKHMATVIGLNLTIGLLSQGIDNWGHVGGLVGGAAVSWLIGPAWKFQSVSRDGRKIFEDKAPIFSLMKRRDK